MWGSIFLASALLVHCCFCYSCPVGASGFPLVFRALCPTALPSLQPHSSSHPLTSCLPACSHRFLCLCPLCHLCLESGLGLGPHAAVLGEATARCLRICTNHSCVTCCLSSSHTALCCLVCWAVSTSNCKLFDSISSVFRYFFIFLKMIMPHKLYSTFLLSLSSVSQGKCWAKPRVSTKSYYICNCIMPWFEKTFPESLLTSYLLSCYRSLIAPLLP